MSIATAVPPFVLCEVEVVRVERLTPAFVRLELAAPELADFGTGGPLLDQRIKLVVPDGSLPPAPVAAVDGWYAEWSARPQPERGHMRTYTVRRLLGHGAGVRLVVDVVVHEDGHAGPGAAWALAARPGDRVLLAGPRRGHAWGGIEYDPGTAGRVLLAGDETAVPAVLAILEQVEPRTRGAAFLEVPTSADVLTAQHPAGVALHWLPRDGRPLGERLHEAVLEHLGERPAAADLTEGPEDVWETPTYSASGESVDDPVRSVGHELDDLYAWIAGESRVVTGLRRALVRDIGLDRHQVAFMGYWRQGVSMKG